MNDRLPEKLLRMAIPQRERSLHRAAPPPVALRGGRPSPPGPEPTPPGPRCAPSAALPQAQLAIPAGRQQEGTIGSPGTGEYLAAVPGRVGGRKELKRGHDCSPDGMFRLSKHSSRPTLMQSEQITAPGEARRF